MSTLRSTPTTMWISVSLPNLLPLLGDLEWSTPGGGSPPAQTWREPSLSTQAELVGHATTLRVVPPTTSVYLTTHSISTTRLVSRGTHWSMELSLKRLLSHLAHLTSTMFLAPFAMLPTAQCTSWFLPGTSVPLNGPGSTMATSCPRPANGMVAIAPCLSVWTTTQTQFQVKVPAPTLL